jgi:hypothetical protein
LWSQPAFGLGSVFQPNTRKVVVCLPWLASSYRREFVRIAASICTCVHGVRVSSLKFTISRAMRMALAMRMRLPLGRSRSGEVATRS